MLLTIVLMVAGFLLLYFGAEWLIRGGVSIALRLGLTPLVVGLTIVAFGTSSPELVVSINASLSGSGDLAVGNVVGSNICNVALILGLTAVIRPVIVDSQLLRFDVPVVLVSSIVLFWFLSDGSLGRLEGLILFASLLVYIAISLQIARRSQQAVREEFAEALPSTVGGLFKDIFLILIGLGMLVFGANLFVDGAVAIARFFGVSEATIGLTIVALGTSLPELATSAVAALKGEGDIAIGNVIGSNIFNIMSILGITAIISPLFSAGIGLVDLGLMVILVIVLIPLLWSGFRLNRWEGGFLLFTYMGYVYYILDVAA